MTNKGRAKGPLKKIAWVVEGTHEPGRSRVRLECGHEVYTSAIYRARCWRCQKDAEPTQIELKATALTRDEAAQRALNDELGIAFNGTESE